jgi:hypothetical protein
MIKALYFQDCNASETPTTGGGGNTIIINNNTTQVNNNQYVTVLQEVKNFYGDRIETVVNVVNNVITNVVTNWAVLNRSDYYITNIDNRQYIVFNETVQNLYTEITYHNVYVENIGANIKGGFMNTEAAKAAGLKVGDMYYLLQENDPSQYSGVVVYIAQ